ncbi:MAG: diadenylate cyclase, partial [Planctomycetota bacterium]
MNFDIFGCNIRIDLMGVLEILILYLLAFLFIRFVLLSRLAMHLKLFIGLFILAVIMLEILGTTFSDSNIFIIKYRNIIYIGAFVIFFSIFQPELRHFILNAFTLYKNRHLSPIGVCQIADFLKPLQKEKLGALIVVQNSISVEPYISSYIEIDAKLSTEMLLSIFSKSSI